MERWMDRMAWTSMIRYKEGFGDGLFYGSMLCLTVFMSTMGISHWFYSA